MISFIGIGNMGGSMIRRLASSRDRSSEIGLFDVNAAAADTLSKELGVTKFESSGELVKRSDIIILAVKPNVVRSVLTGIKEAFFSDDRILITIAAGLPISFYKDILGDSAKVIRTMPNMPAQVGEGMTLLSSDGLVNENEMAEAKAVFDNFGRTEIVDESMMNSVIALTSSSPAYVFMFIEAMADAAVQSGIPRKLAYEMAAQAVYGSAKLVLETGRHPAELKDAVCSPAGTTIEAVAKLEEKGFRDAVISAMKACTDKANGMKG